MNYEINNLSPPPTNNVFKKIIRKILHWSYGPLIENQANNNDLFISYSQEMLEENKQAKILAKEALTKNNHLKEKISSLQNDTKLNYEAAEQISLDITAQQILISENQGLLEWSSQAINVLQNDLQSVSLKLDHCDTTITVSQKDLNAVSGKLDVLENNATDIFNQVNNQVLTDIKYLKEQIVRLGQQVKKSKSSDSLEHNKNTTIVSDAAPIEQEVFDFDYTTFESIYRGASENIKQTFHKYLPFLENKDNILDVGCGSGEFLELMQENGKQQLKGIDFNEEMVDAAQEKNLPVIYGDAVKFLKTSDNLKLEAVFSSQVVEHLSNVQIVDLIEGAYENLADNGVIILETINPMALYAYVMSYPLDPTHDRMIHPYTLKFMLESHGFVDVEILFSSDTGGEYVPLPDEGNSQIKNHNKQMQTLYKQVFGCLDYAVIGYKK